MVLQRDVDDGLVVVFLVEYVGGEQSFTLAQTERVEVNVVALQSHAGVVERCHASSRDEDTSTLAAGDETQHARSLAATAGHDDDVVDFADGRATRIKQRQPHDAVRVDEVRCWRHEARLPRHSYVNLADFETFRRRPSLSSVAQVAQGECHVFTEIDRRVREGIHLWNERPQRDITERVIGDDGIGADHPQIAEEPGKFAP